MGFDLQILRFTMDAWREGANFERAACLGRQHLNVDRKTYAKEARRYGLPSSEADIDMAYKDYPYADGFLKALGATTPDSVDAADFEGATHIADMNRPLPDEMKSKFSVIIDGGTLEHIFDFGQSVRNVAHMLEEGGHFVSINGANNFTGHGFYQFSPELFFRTFSAENGFDVESMVLTECNDDGIWHDVVDPAVAGCRVQLVNNARTYLMMRARKIATREMFKQPPQQSDYHDAAWQESQPSDLSFLKRPLRQRIVEKAMPRPARTVFRRAYQATRHHFSSPHLNPRERFD